jgi:hypothetical protein
MMEIRLAISALLLKYESWSGVPDKPGEWDELLSTGNVCSNSRQEPDDQSISLTREVVDRILRHEDYGTVIA